MNLTVLFDQTMIMNTSAPFLFEVPPFFNAFKEAWEYLDIVVGNESEAAAMGKAFGFSATSVKEIAIEAAKLPKKNSSKPRMVVITQGSECTIVATPEGATEYPVTKVDKVVDTNGAGKSFCPPFSCLFSSPPLPSLRHAPSLSFLLLSSPSPSPSFVFPHNRPPLTYLTGDAFCGGFFAGLMLGKSIEVILTCSAFDNFDALGRTRSSAVTTPPES